MPGGGIGVNVEPEWGSALVSGVVLGVCKEAEQPACRLYRVYTNLPLCFKPSLDRGDLHSNDGQKQASCQLKLHA